MRNDLTPEDWELQMDADGELTIHGQRATALAAEYGTPLHLLDECRLERRARFVAAELQSPWPGKSSVHYAFKCNSVPGALRVIRSASLCAEVCTEQELRLALLSGFHGGEIIVNGPWKSAQFLRACLEARVRLIVVDAPEELRQLESVCASEGREAEVLLRINPDVTPKGLNRGSATGSRKGCAFGFDLTGGEAHAAIRLLDDLRGIRFRGFHFHIGTGIADPAGYANAIDRLAPLVAHAAGRGHPVAVLDVGGGIGSPTARELTSREMLLSQLFGRFPPGLGRNRPAPIRVFGETISAAARRLFRDRPLPELVFEPGRCIASGSQFLLLAVRRVKERAGLPDWIVADGGLGTVTLPCYYEYHELFLCNDLRRPRARRATIVGPCCFAGDVVYRNRLLPRVAEGEVLAVMDSGAYFTALESSFGVPRPALVGVDASGARCLRSRESIEQMNERDLPFTHNLTGA